MILFGIVLSFILPERAWPDLFSEGWKIDATKSAYGDEFILLSKLSCETVLLKKEHFKDKNQYNAALTKKWSERSQEVQHALDLQGLNKSDYDLYRRDLLKKTDTTYQNLTSQQLRRYAKTVDHCVQILKNQMPEQAKFHRKLLAALKKENETLATQKQTQPITNDTFVDFLFSLWKLKKGVLEELKTISLSSYQRDRYLLMKDYRENIEKTYKTYKTNGRHILEFMEGSLPSIELYLKDHPKSAAKWQGLSDKLTDVIPGFSLQEGKNTAMIVGKVYEAGTGKGISGVQLRIQLEGGNLIEQEISGGKMLLPRSYHTVSDQSGHFIFPALAVDRYVIPSQSLISEENIRYNNVGRKFFIESPEEILTIDIPLNRLDAK